VTLFPANPIDRLSKTRAWYPGLPFSDYLHGILENRIKTSSNKYIFPAISSKNGYITDIRFQLNIINKATKIKSIE
jgi:hypothetical protein